MFRLSFLYCLWAALHTLVLGMSDMGEGRWSVLSLGGCDEEELKEVDLKCAFDATRRKHNRTMDVFDATMNCEEDIDDSYGVLIMICKHVDGGCKEWQVLSDESVRHFVNKYAADNVQRAMQMAQIDPPDFPITAGEYSITDFQLNYCEFEKNCLYGTFTAHSYLVHEGNKVSCVKATVLFDEDTEGYECD